MKTFQQNTEIRFLHHVYLIHLINNDIRLSHSDYDKAHYYAWFDNLHQFTTSVRWKYSFKKNSFDHFQNIWIMIRYLTIPFGNVIRETDYQFHAEYEATNSCRAIYHLNFQISNIIVCNTRFHTICRIISLSSCIRTWQRIQNFLPSRRKSLLSDNTYLKKSLSK